MSEKEERYYYIINLQIKYFYAYPISLMQAVGYAFLYE